MATEGSSKKDEGMSGWVVAGIAVGTMLVGAIGTAAFYEYVVVPDVTEKLTGKAPDGALAKK